MSYYITADALRKQLSDRLANAVSMSNWYFDGGEWWLAEQWHVAAEGFQQQLDEFDAQLRSGTEGKR